MEFLRLHQKYPHPQASHLQWPIVDIVYRLPALEADSPTATLAWNWHPNKRLPCWTQKDLSRLRAFSRSPSGDLSFDRARFRRAAFSYLTNGLHWQAAPGSPRALCIGRWNACTG